MDIGHWEEWKKYFQAKMEKSESFAVISPASLTSGRFIDCASCLIAQMIEFGIQCVQTHWEGENVQKKFNLYICICILIFLCLPFSVWTRSSFYTWLLWHTWTMRASTWTAGRHLIFACTPSWAVAVVVPFNRVVCCALLYSVTFFFRFILQFRLPWRIKLLSWNIDNIGMGGWQYLSQ